MRTIKFDINEALKSKNELSFKKGYALLKKF